MRPMLSTSRPSRARAPRRRPRPRRRPWGGRPGRGGPGSGGAPRLEPQRPLFGLERGERTVRLRDRALGGAQRVARLAAGSFFFLQLLAQPFDSATKRLQVFFFCGRKRIQREKKQRKKRKSLQAFALSSLPTTARRLAISSPSPREWRLIGFRSTPRS